jgi:hypothetical protein
MTEKQLIEIFDLVFGTNHTCGFKKAEMQDFLFDNRYWFLEKPKNNWLFKLREYCKENNVDYSEFDINPHLIKRGEKAGTPPVIENES